MPKPIKEPEGDQELVKVTMNFYGKIIKLLNRIAEQRGISRTALFYIIIRDWLKWQGYEVAPEDFEPPGYGPELGSTYK